jgi:hypothetical protein
VKLEWMLRRKRDDTSRGSGNLTCRTGIEIFKDSALFRSSQGKGLTSQALIPLINIMVTLQVLRNNSNVLLLTRIGD